MKMEKLVLAFLNKCLLYRRAGGGRIHWKWKYKNKNNIEKINLAANYHNDCQRLKEKRVICKIEPQFVNKNIQDEVRKSIEEKLEKTIENLVNRWLNEGIWTGQNLCIFSNKFKPENNGCLKSGKIGEDNSLKTDIEKLIDKNSGRQEKINIEIGDWWLSGRWKNNGQNNEWGRREGKSDGKGVTWKLIEFAGSIGQLSTEALKQAVKELVEEFERMLINQKGDLCGIWNTGITCPDGGLVFYKR